ncbi:YybH family protein [Saccharothrix obliqua]|uniref:YybH family protein n=1 Tax=Saccharothrix obliqua TaxID=2861747 RepID=UPI001C5D6036|nr:nuclear transport factor 2 family protein [Saccharothrix obliqua]MBW4716889.1 nuclear transport factor 2 family protein [Saccharothrix obliqua]
MSVSGALRELNRDVWEPFRGHYRNLDAAAFLDLHEPGLIRAGGVIGQVLGHADYARQTTEWFARVAADGGALDIRFRFVERLVGADVAAERGLFRIDAVRSGEPKVFHGRFHVFSRRSAGRWRIAVDYDSDDGATEEAFAAAVDLADVAAFE